MTTAPNPDQQKRAVAAAALEWAESRLSRDMVIGIGTGSTADHFIDLIAAQRDRFAGVVASSDRSARRLEQAGVRVFDLDDVAELPFYVDGADEINDRFEMTKGGGGALTREKIVAAASRTFVCIADQSKRVAHLGRFPLPIEVIPMARSQVVRAIGGLGDAHSLGKGDIRLRAGPDGAPYVTDNGNWIIDVGGWTIPEPCAVETAIGAIVGVVESGLFALRPADLLVTWDAPSGVTTTSRIR
jgi:ribose 5-phosphate isomerase A